MKCFKNDLSLAFLLVFLIFNTLVLWAQDTASAGTATQPVTTTQIDMDEAGAWYTNPWVWLLAAAFFTFLLVLLLRSGRKRNSVRQQEGTTTASDATDADAGT